MDGGAPIDNNDNNNKIIIREYSEERDGEMVERLERECEMISSPSTSKGMNNIHIFTNFVDPLCRIRFYAFHVLLVAEMVDSGELVGVVRGCIKCVGTAFEGRHVKMGCLLGLRVSPKHRRNGIALRLVTCIELWATQNGAQYICIAAEEKNVASTNLFVRKCNYVKLLTPLVILMQPIHFRKKDPSSSNIKIHKLSIVQAISLYKNRLGKQEFFPVDIDAILNHKLSLGTWVSSFKDENWMGLGKDNKDDDNQEFTSKTPSSWAMLSIWNKTSDAYKFQQRRNTNEYTLKCFNCFRLPIFDLLVDLVHDRRPFGYVFLYGFHGEGQRVGELMKSLWWFANNLGRNVKDCKLMITELGFHDPLREHVPPSASSINDIWYLKKLNGSSTSDYTNDEEDDSWTRRRPITNLFVDPRDF